MNELREITEHYRLAKILKSTRFGSVLAATDARSGEPVVIKLLTMGPSPEVRMDRFRRLATTLAALRHPALPAVRDFGFTPDGSAFLVMEPLTGRPLEELAGEPPARLLALLARAAEGLEALAERGFAHGNLSPDNLLVAGGAGGDDGVKLLGLGTAVFRLASTEGAGGDPRNARFRAPEERVPGPGSVGGWATDLWSLALTASAVLAATVTGEGSPAPRVALSLGVGFELDDAESLRALLEAALRRAPEARPTPVQMQRALRRAVGAAPAVGPGTPAIEQTRPAFLPGEAAPASPAARVVPFPVPAAPASRPSAPSAPPAAVPAAAARGQGLPSAGAAALAAAAPLPEPEAEPASELLTSVTDEMLQRLAAPPPPPPPPSPAAEAPARRRRALPLVAAGAGLLIAAALGVWWLAGRAEEPPPPPPPPPPQAVPPPPAPAEPPAVRLAAARDWLAQGEDARAFEALRSLTPVEQGALSPAECELIRCLDEILAASAPERLAADLARGLEQGDLTLLGTAIRRADELPGLALSSEATEALSRARRAGELRAQAEAAAAKGESLPVLEHFAAMAELVPGLTDAGGLREKAAAAVEAEAEALLAQARFDEALARLAPLERTWPGRPGLAERVQECRRQKEEEARVKGLLDQAEAAEKRREPDAVLAPLRKVAPTAHLEPRYREVVARLEAQLASLDGKPPTIELREGFVLEYARGTVAEVSFRVEDDYRVDSVKVYARAGQQGKMTEVPYEKTSRFAYTVEIHPDFHRNETVDFYVVATDASGHEATLGSPGKPLQITRRKGFREG